MTNIYIYKRRFEDYTFMLTLNKTKHFSSVILQLIMHIRELRKFFIGYAMDIRRAKAIPIELELFI